MPEFPRERLVNSIREAAKFVSRGERLVILHDWEAKDVVVAWDAEHAARLAAEAALDETPTPDPLTSDEPIHAAFGLSYASYLVVPRTVLQSMPVAWQAKFVALMNETHERFPGWEPPWPQGWTVHLRGEKGRFLEDDLARYERGRRQLEPGKPARAGVDTWPDGGATP